MALKIKPRAALDDMIAGTKCSHTLDILKKLKTDTIASYTYKIYDSSNTDVTDTFGGGSSISSGIITFGIKAIEAGSYTLEFIITCNEVLPNSTTPREFYMTMTVQIIDTILVKPESEESAFVFTIQTAGASETFSLPLEATGTYAFNIDWGDSSSDDIIAYNQAEVTHTYASAGTYEISITGTIIGWFFNWEGDKDKIYEIKSWGPLRLGNSGGFFGECVNLTITATDILDLTGTTNLKWAFDACYSLTTIPSLNSWDMSLITDISYMLSFNPLFNQDVSSWDVSSVTTAYGTFADSSSFNQNLSSWDITSFIVLGDFLYGTTLSIANYDALLISWEAQAVQDNVNFYGGRNNKYSAGAAATARAALITDHNWTIIDGGQV